MLRLKFFLKKIIKISYIIIIELFGIGFLMRLINQKEKRLFILTYHKITDDQRESYYCVTKSNFNKQIEYLRERFDIISINDVIAYLEGRLQLGQMSCCITFDDGYKDIYKHVLPLLKKYKFPIAVGLVIDYIDKNKEFTWDKRFHLKDRELLGSHEIRELVRCGVSFGSHSANHMDLAKLNQGQLRYEVLSSKHAIENILNKETDFFIYPFGSLVNINQQVIEMVKEARYKIALTSIWGWVSRKNNPYLLKRINIDGSDNMLTFKAKLSGSLNLLSIFDSRIFEILRRINNYIFQ